MRPVVDPVPSAVVAMPKRRRKRTSRRKRRPSRLTHRLKRRLMDRLSKLVPSRRRLVTTAIGILVVALVGAWVLDDLVGGPEVRRGTRVVGTEIGGLNRDAAIDTLAPLAEAIGSTPVELQLHDRSIESTIAELGMQLDVEATVASASGHPSVVVRPAAWIADFIGSRDVDPVLAVDIDALERALQDLGADPETPQIELVDGSLQPVIGAVIPVPDLELLADVLVVSATSKPSEPITIVVPTRGTATPDPTAAAEVGYPSQRTHGRRRASTTSGHRSNLHHRRTCTPGLRDGEGLGGRPKAHVR